PPRAPRSPYTTLFRSRGVLVHPQDLVVGDRHACAPARLRPFSPPVGAPILSRVGQTSSSSASVSTSIHLAMLSASSPFGTVATSTACHIRHTIVQPDSSPSDASRIRRSSTPSTSRSRSDSRSPAVTASTTAGMAGLSTAERFTNEVGDKRSLQDILRSHNLPQSPARGGIV